MHSAPHTVGILGGMGPAAGADFARLFVVACGDRIRALGAPVTDQAYPEHWLAQVPVPDRMRALHGDTPVQPLDALLVALGRLTALGARAVAIACNTAHVWHAPLQQRFPQVELLHIADEVAQALRAAGVRQACLLATEGTYDSGMYEHSFARAGIALHVPDAALRRHLTTGIFRGVKAGRLAFARRRFGWVARRMAQTHPGSAMVLGCTEIPLALRDAPGLLLVDPAEVLARALAARAYA